MVDAITPNEVGEAKENAFGAQVMEVWNAIIASKFTNGRAVVRQNEVIDALQVATGKSRNDIFDKGWLNIEEVYRSKGWSVHYDKPAYYETHEPKFTFTPKG